MSIEIEAKMRLTDPDAVIARLKAMDAVRVGELRETNTFFDTHDSQLKTSDQGLRVRIEAREDGERLVTITHKGPRAHGQLKSRRETEVRVEDPKDAADVLTALGYEPVLAFEKRRVRYRVNGSLVELDTLPHLGQFIEIEGPSEKDVLELRKALGLEDVPLIKASYIAMLLTFLRENNLGSQMVSLSDRHPPAAAQV